MVYRDANAFLNIIFFLHQLLPTRQNLMEESMRDSMLLDLNCSWDGCIEPIDDVHMSQALITNEIRSDINSESNVKDPEVGMTFPSWDAVDSYYHAYGKQRGFGVIRAAVSYKQKGGISTREKRAGIWRCDCWGKTEKKTRVQRQACSCSKPYSESPTNKTSSSKKCECPAMVYAKPNKCNEWELCTVVLEHKNHTPTPSKSRHIPKYRDEELNKSNVARNLFNANAAGVRTVIGTVAIILEKEADANCWKYTRTLLTAFPFEAQSHDVYTDAKFKEVQVQCSRVLYVTPLEKTVVGDNVVEHLLEDIVYTTNKEKQGGDCNDEKKDLLCTICTTWNMFHPNLFYGVGGKIFRGNTWLLRWRTMIFPKLHKCKRFDKLMVEFERGCLKGVSVGCKYSHLYGVDSTYGFTC
ncbi:Protein FAR1-RELATED SEQUENCE 8 [Bienertia sinuspersici]